MTDAMKALLLGRGPEWVLDDVPVPKPGPGEWLIRDHDRQDRLHSHEDLFRPSRHHVE